MNNTLYFYQAKKKLNSRYTQIFCGTFIKTFLPQILLLKNMQPVLQF